jgi:surfeit locus 1 family protein
MVTPQPAMSRSASRTRAIVVLLAMLVGVGGTARLGVWQLDRATQKEALQARLDARASLPELPAVSLARTDEDLAVQVDRRIRLQGEWVPHDTVFLDNRQMSGRVGFYVVTPLRIAGSDRVVVVQRGWVPRDAADRSRLPSFPTPAGEVTVVGRIAPPPARLYEFSAAASGPIRQNLDLAAYSRETGLQLAPLAIVQDEPGGPDDGLLRQWPHPAVDVHKHYGYAFQWFALCALMAGLYVWFQLLRPRLGRA